jgi:DNA-binding XRE family transcriptional regulator
MRYRTADGAKLRAIRIKRQLRQVDLAESVRVLPSTLCKIEGGTYQPSDLLAERLAVALNCAVEDFTGEKVSVVEERAAA